MKDSAYATLCDAIVDGTLAPGEMLHDDELCAWLGLSRTPVRGALARLEAEGLIETAPQRFTRVTPLESDDAAELFPVLAVLHALATELATPLLEPNDLLALRDANERHIGALTARNGPAAYEADDRFHAIFVRVAGNSVVTASVAALEPRMHRLELLHAGALPGRRALAQHEAILARASAGDAIRAASAAREHWLTFGAMVERALSSSG